MGDTVPLSGYSPTSTSVYLFLTGPNLPVNGVALNDITKRADEGGFTVVQVMGEDDRWTYNWHTSSINGRLDDGTYTVWAVNGPNDRSNLQNAEYGTISVTLGRPGLSASTSTGISASTSSRPGSLLVIATPGESSVVVNDQYRGKTPLTLDSLDPGTYTVVVSKFGYTPQTATVRINSGEQAEVTVTLAAERGSLSVNTTPPGANVSLDGIAVGISPGILSDILPGNHTLTVTREGYLPVEQQVVITAGETSPAAITLVPVSPLSSFPLKTPGLTVTTLLALCAAAGAVMYRGSRAH
jgi:hypothetical protein